MPFEKVRIREVKFEPEFDRSSSSSSSLMMETVPYQLID